MRFKLDAMFNKFSRGIEQPSMPKIEKSGKFTVKQMVDSVTDPKATDYVDELRNADEKNRDLHSKLTEALKKNETLNQDLKLMRDVIDSRDKEIHRLSSLYDVDQHLDKVTEDYEHDRLVKKVEQLQKQLDFLNQENNKLTTNFISSQKELNFYQNSKREIDILTKKLVSAEDQKTKFEKQVTK